eukprot:TRINITY_DN12872_c0_g1_i5.p1 TRINITY_DN12872_c0_g1~~TRINITY_DN12872_c0_g1_i5.p1  ORF type:complete len:194 (+),score=17.21 TRINITY_DN12872_c0_g1_i5:65-646(+)
MCIRDSSDRDPLHRKRSLQIGRVASKLANVPTDSIKIKELSLISQEMRKTLSSKLEEYLELYKVLRDCWKCLQEMFERSQRTSFDKGLTKSLLMEYLNLKHEKAFFMTESKFNPEPFNKALDPERSKHLYIDENITLNYNQFSELSTLQLFTLIIFVPEGVSKVNLEWDFKKRQYLQLQHKLRNLTREKKSGY